MEYEPTAQDVQELIEDFQRDFGVSVAPEDARRILALYGELCMLFDECTGGEPIPPHLVLER